MKKYTITLLVFLIIPLVLSAQKRKTPEYDRVGDFIFKNYHPDSAALAKYCGIGCVFVKFKISKQGEIINVAFSGDADSTKFINDGLTLAIKSIKKDTALINFLKKTGRAITQPFMYNYQAGCNFPKSNSFDSNEDFYKAHFMLSESMNHLYKSMLNVLKFNDGTLKVFDGVLLSPILVGSGSIE